MDDVEAASRRGESDGKCGETGPAAAAAAATAAAACQDESGPAGRDRCQQPAERVESQVRRRLCGVRGAQAQGVGPTISRSPVRALLRTTNPDKQTFTANRLDADCLRYYMQSSNEVVALYVYCAEYVARAEGGGSTYGLLRRQADSYVVRRTVASARVRAVEPAASAASPGRRRTPGGQSTAPVAQPRAAATTKPRADGTCNRPLPVRALYSDPVERRFSSNVFTSMLLVFYSGPRWKLLSSCKTVKVSRP